MNRDSVIDWQELSALYEQVDDLDADGIDALLGRLGEERHRLLPMLRRMLDARRQAVDGAFLESLRDSQSRWRCRRGWKAEGSGPIA